MTEKLQKAEALRKEINDCGRKLVEARQSVGKARSRDEGEGVHELAVSDFMLVFFEAGFVIFQLVWAFHEHMPDAVMVLTVPLIFGCAAALLLGMFANKASDDYQRKKNSFFRISVLIFLAVAGLTVYYMEPDTFNIGIVLSALAIVLQCVLFVRFSKTKNAQTLKENREYNEKEQREYLERKKKAEETEKELQTLIQQKKEELEQLLKNTEEVQ